MLEQVKTASGVNVILGIWLIISPFLLGYSGSNGFATWNDMVVGIIVLILAGTSLANVARTSGLSWTNAVLGAWLIVAPIILGYSADTAALWNDIIVGTALLLFGTWGARAAREA